MDDHIKNRDHKKIFVSAGIVVVAVALIVSILLIRANANGASLPAFIGIKDARVLPQDGKCLANNATTKARTEAQQGLGENDGFWTSYIYDVPAGTNVDVNIATYNETDSVTGSLVYSNNYGSYNFTATKQANEWRYTAFTRCQ